MKKILALGAVVGTLASIGMVTSAFAAVPSRAPALVKLATPVNAQLTQVFQKDLALMEGQNYTVGLAGDTVTTSNPAVIQVQGENAVAVAPGQATITVVHQVREVLPGNPPHCVVLPTHQRVCYPSDPVMILKSEVTMYHVTVNALSQQFLTLNVGQSYNLGSASTAHATSSNPSVVRIEGTNAVAVAPGVADISVLQFPNPVHPLNGVGYPVDPVVHHIHVVVVGHIAAPLPLPPVSSVINEALGQTYLFPSTEQVSIVSGNPHVVVPITNGFRAVGVGQATVTAYVRPVVNGPFQPMFIQVKHFTVNVLPGIKPITTLPVVHR